MKASTIDLVMALLGIGWFVLAVWLLYVTVSIRNITSRQGAIVKAGEDEDFVETVNNSLNKVHSLNSALDGIRDNQARLEAAMNTSIRHIGMVRFDAFEDVGGKQSFAVALLNDNRDGVVISAINGRREGRSYAKFVKNGDSKFSLSGEERQAISEALSGDKVRV